MSEHSESCRNRTTFDSDHARCQCSCHDYCDRCGRLLEEQACNDDGTPYERHAAALVDAALRRKAG